MILFRILPEIHKSNLAYPCLSFVLPQGPSLINVTGEGKKRKKEKRETRTAIKRERERRGGGEREKVQCNHMANPAIYRFGIFI